MDVAVDDQRALDGAVGHQHPNCHGHIVEDTEAGALREAGVDAQVRVYEDMVHDFARLGNIVEQAEELRAELSACLRQWHARAVPAAPAGRTALA